MEYGKNRMFIISMFSDIQSVRSLPTSPRRVQFRHSALPYDLEYPSDHSRVGSPRHYEHWRTSIHPDIHDKYRSIMNGEPLSCHCKPNRSYNLLAKTVDKVEEDTNSKSLSPDRKSSSSANPLDVEDKIKGLEQQNENLKE